MLHNKKHNQNFKNEDQHANVINFPKKKSIDLQPVRYVVLLHTINTKVFDFLYCTYAERECDINSVAPT